MTDEKQTQNVEYGISLRYTGGRFDGARLPLDVLADLPAFRDLLVAFARQEWLRTNTSRKRVPKGFDKSLSFDLADIRPGSAIPVMQWDRTSAQNFLPGFTGELEEVIVQSYSDIVELIDQASHGRFPNALASEHVRALNKFGSGLRDGERIEFVSTVGVDGNVVFLDSYRRKALITKVRETYVSRYEGTGKLVGTQANAGTEGSIDVDTDLHGVITILLDRERVLSEFDGSLHAPVQFDLQVELDNTDKYRSIVEVHAVALIDERIAADLERCRTRLFEIGMLADGWDDGRGSVIAVDVMASANTLLRKRPFLCSAYRIFPTVTGGVLFEFETNGWDLSLEIVEGGAVEIFGFEVDGEDELLPKRFDGVAADVLAELDKYVGNDGR